MTSSTIGTSEEFKRSFQAGAHSALDRARKAIAEMTPFSHRYVTSINPNSDEPVYIDLRIVLRAFDEAGGSGVREDPCTCGVGWGARVSGNATCHRRIRSRQR